MNTRREVRRPWIRYAGLLWAAVQCGYAGGPLTAQVAAVPILEYRFAGIGVEFRLLVCGEERSRVEQACATCRRRVEELNQIFSDYSANSEVARLRLAPVGEPVPVSAEMYTLLSRGQEVSRRSDGAFDVTVGPLTQRWRTARRAGKLPDGTAWQVARASVGWHQLELMEPDRIRLRRPGMELDFGGIGQGFAADECLEILRRAGFPAALVDASGDIAIGEPPPQRPQGWRVAVASDPAASDMTSYLELARCGIATSGDQLQHLQQGSDRLSHILDPRSGEPVRNAPRVTVIARDATEADALASALSVLSAEQGLALIDTTEGASALLVYGESHTDQANACSAARVQKSSRFPEFVPVPAQK